MNGYNQLPNIPLDVVKETNQFIADCERSAARYGMRALQHYCSTYKNMLQEIQCINQSSSLHRFCECISDCADKSLEDTIIKYKTGEIEPRQKKGRMEIYDYFER